MESRSLKDCDDVGMNWGSEEPGRSTEVEVVLK